MKLTNRQALAARIGLQTIDAGRNTIVKDGDRNCVVKEPYEMGEGALLLMVQWLNALDRTAADVSAANNKIIRQFSGGGNSFPTKSMVDDRGNAKDEEAVAKIDGFNTAIENLLDTEVKFSLSQIGEHDLRLGKNRYRMETLSQIWPIVKWGASATKMDDAAE